MPAGVPVLGEMGVYPGRFNNVLKANWGLIEVSYKIVDAATGACPA